MPQPGPGTDREALFLSQLDLIERVIAYTCARQRLAASDAEDFASYVKLKFVESDYALLAKFEGRSSVRTFLTVVVQRMFLDYRISAWGKWRPSAAARRAGPVAVLLERLMIRDGYPFQQACEVLRTNHRVDANHAELERLAGRLPIRTRRHFEPDEALAEMPSRDRGLDDLAAERDRRVTADRLSDAVPTLMARMDVQDRLILTMRFEDGCTVAEIATILRLDQKPLYRRVDRLLKELRQGLEAEGIDCASVLEMLESPAVSIEWKDREHAEKMMASPSIKKGTR
jgi:RNA polymerase sigma factor for flagellar operon FliA